MAQKVVGYREMIWTCPNCGTKNPGSSRTCRSCGAAMGEDVKFEQQTNAGMIHDEKIIENAKKGPDIYCAYCGNRNPAGTKKCLRCGADLSEGKEREHGSQHSAHINEQVDGSQNAKVICQTCGSENPASALKCRTCGAPLNVSREKEEISSTPNNANNSKKGGGRGCLMIILFLIIFGFIAMFFFNGCGSGGNLINIANPGGTVSNTLLNAVVSEQKWQTSVEVIGPVDSRGSGWRGDIPNDARNIRCEDRIRYTSDVEKPNSVEVCGTPYAVDLGNGFEQFVQDCVYNVYDSYCQYTVSKLGVVDTATVSGSGPNPEAPYVDSKYTTGDQSVRYTVTIQDENGKIYTLNPTNLSEYRSYAVGTEYEIEVNSRGRIVNMEKK